MNGPLSDTAQFVPAIKATITTTPAARTVVVDGSSYTSPKSFDWLAGSQHTIAAVTPQLAGTDTQYVFAGWSDSGAIAHVVAPTRDTAFGAVFKVRYYLTMRSNAGGTVLPSSGWFDENQTVTISAPPDSGYHFNAWTGTGNGSYSGFIDTATVTMRAAIAETANFGVILSPPVLAGLPDGASGVTTSPVFHWMHYAGASTYRLQLSKMSDFAQTSYDSSGIVDTSVGLALLANLQMYHWRVSATVGTNSSPFSPARSFTTLNATIAASSPLVNWGTGYRYAIHWTSTDLSGPVNIRLSTNNGTSYIRVADSVQNTGLYRWTIPDSQAFMSAACILRIESAFNNLLYGESNAFSIVSGTLPASVPMSKSIAFPAEPKQSTDYKLVSVPGIVDSTKIGTLLSGQQGTDWRMFRDNGNAESYLVELSANSLLSTGEGYWLVKKGNLDIPTFNMKMPRLTQDATYSVPLDSGWNIIANPFDKTLPWGAVLDANGLPSGTELLGYNSAYLPVDSLERFGGYYFDNATNLQALTMPYPFGASSPSSTAATSAVLAKTWALQLEFDSDINTDRENYIGIAPAAAQGFDQLDMHKPPLFLDQGFLYFKRPDWDARYPRFRSDFRPAIGGGQEWDFEISNPRLSEGTIRVHGIENIPAEYAVVIVNAYNSNPVDARVQPVYSFKSVGKTMPFKILVGPRSFVDAELSKLVPQSFELMQNFPNPFNLSTSISVSLPKETQLRLEVYNILGQRVRSLAEGEYAPGIHTFVWDGADGSGKTAASGVYMYRVTEGGTLLGVKKMILTK
jgi:hypothetical protein